MFQNVQFECLPSALWSREVETLRMEPEPTVQSCSCADATKSQQRSKALISVYNYNYSTKLSKSESQIDPSFLSLFCTFLPNCDRVDFEFLGDEIICRL